MALDIQGILNAAISHAMASGHFEQVNGHEPENAPQAGGLTAAVWVDQVTPVLSSGLDSTSVRISLTVRMYTSMLSEPRDAIDPQMMAALDDLLAAYSGDFTLGGTVREVDLLGSSGVALQARAGYLNQDTRLYRVYTITLPVIVNDLWDQGE